MGEALLYERLPENRVRCNMCAQECAIKPGKRGLCGVRENREGTLYSLVHGLVIAENLDPIEKKPFFHVCPGSLSLSIASAGCNFQCIFCQNHEISQMPRERKIIPGRKVKPEHLVGLAVESGSASIAYTYTEPTISLEFACEVAEMATDKGILNVFVTNGYLSEQALKLVSPYLDAANVDLKSFNDGFYRRYCGGRLQPVLDTLRRLREQDIWIEVTTLIIPGLNDTPEELRQLARFIRSLGAEVPWHISRFHPRYRLHTIGSTPAETIAMAREIGREEGLKYLYAGNLPGDEGEKTFCAACGTLLIDREGYRINSINLVEGGTCPNCTTKMEGIFQARVSDSNNDTSA